MSDCVARVASLWEVFLCAGRGHIRDGAHDFSRANPACRLSGIPASILSKIGFALVSFVFVLGMRSVDMDGRIYSVYRVSQPRCPPMALGSGRLPCLQQGGRPIRYYRVTISDPQSGNVLTPPGFDASLLGGASYTSFVNGKTLSAAWDVLLDIPSIDAATSQGFANLSILGVSIQEIQQSNDLNGKNIVIEGGMQAGLPLANPAQAGQLTSGNILQCYGHWEGKNMSLEFVIAPGPASGSNTGGIGTLGKPKALVLNWTGGQPMSDAIKSALSTAFQGYTINVNISPDIVRPAGDNIQGQFGTLEQIARAARDMSKSIVKTQNYPGISIVMNGNTIDVFDGTQTQSNDQPIAIAFTDLIGQPTWIQSPNISAKVVMRGDMKVGQKFTLPQTQIINSADANSNLINQRATFQGGFTVVSLRHVGAYRNPSGDAWVTVIEGAPNNVVGTTS